MEIKVRYLADIEEIEKVRKGDWVDLRAAKDITMKAGEYKLIPLGVAMQLPEGYEALVVPRSSTYKNFGVLQANGVGVIDQSYCGDNDQWHFPAYATRDTEIHKNDRICQFRILYNQPPFDIIPVDTLGNKDRGGIGSTGVQ